MDAHTGSLEELLAHSEWVRGLARRLVLDDATTDDIVQEVWAAALTERSVPRAPRAWLARVVRNLVGTSQRGARNRVSRENQASRVEALPSVEEVASRAELERGLIERVHGLAEEQRNVVLLRFFEGMAPREIAQTLGVPVATVHSRTARALGILRGQLDREFGDRQFWNLALVPLAHARPVPGVVGSAPAVPLIGGLVMKGLGVALASVLVVGSLVLWSQKEGARDAPQVPELAMREGRSALEAPSVVASAEQEQSHERREVVLALESEELQTEPAQSPAPAAIGSVVRGEVIRVDEDGSVHSGYSGRGFSRIWENGEPRWQSFGVQSGHFQLELSKPAEFELLGMTLDGLPLRPETTGDRIPLDGTPLVLRVVPMPVIELSVVDAESGSHLARVELRDRWTSPTNQVLIPDEQWDRRVLERDSSPLTFRATPQQSTNGAWRYLVHSPGYAWTPVDIDMRKSGRHEVRLERAARLHVEVLGGSPKGEAASVRLYVQDERSGHASRLVVESLVRDKMLFQFQDLPSGSYSIRVEIGAPHSEKRVLSESVMEIRPGDDRSVTLEPEHLPEAILAQLSGVVSVPPAWECREIFVFARLNDAGLMESRSHLVLSQDQLTPIEGLAGSYRFDFGPVQTGAYTVGVDDEQLKNLIDTSILVEVRPEGERDLRLTVGVPVLVQVVVLDRAKGRLIEGRLAWKKGPPRDGGLIQFAARNEQAGRFEFRAPKGNVMLFFNEPEFSPIIEAVTLEDGLNTFSYTLERVHSVRITLHAGDSRVAIREGWMPTVRHSIHSKHGHLRRYATEEGAGILSLTQPGRYVLEGFSMDGYEPTADVEFLAVRGETPEVSLQLTAK